MIVDAFLYAGERDMLELRMRTLRDVVDAFVIVQCNRTHQGDRIGSWGDYWAEGDLSADWPWLQRPWLSHLVEVPPLPAGERGGAGSAHYQVIERQHRDGISAALERVIGSPCLTPDTVVMVSDVDEIPDPTIVEHLAAFCDGNTATGWVVLQQRFHSTAIDLLHPHQPWLGTCAARMKDLAPQAMRDARGDYTKMAHCAPGGWHLSWFGTDEERQRKLDTFSHAELRDTFDPTAARAHRRHSNGERLTELTPDEIRKLDWPAPIVDESFRVPAHWVTRHRDTIPDLFA